MERTWITYRNRYMGAMYPAKDKQNTGPFSLWRRTLFWQKLRKITLESYKLW